MSALPLFGIKKYATSQVPGSSGHDPWQVRSCSPAKFMAGIGAGAAVESPMMGSAVPMPSLADFSRRQPATAALHPPPPQPLVWTLVAQL